MNYVLKTKNLVSEYNVILIYYVMGFFNPKNQNYFKSLFKHLNFIIFKKILL